MNITDEDSETPLFVVETVEVARYLLEHGADLNHRNNDGELVRISNAMKTSLNAYRLAGGRQARRRCS